MNKLVFVFCFFGLASGACNAAGRNECPELATKSAFVENMDYYVDLTASRPNCASPYGMLALTALYSARPFAQLYMPGAPRDCPSREKLENINNNLRIAVEFSDDALGIERDYFNPWLVKLLSTAPFHDGQYGMPSCAQWFMGNGDNFIQVLKSGMSSLSSPDDKLSLIKEALELTLIQGYFRSDNGIFQRRANGIVPAFLSPSQEADLKKFALKELSGLASSPLNKDFDRQFVKNALSYLKSVR